MFRKGHLNGSLTNRKNTSGSIIWINSRASCSQVFTQVSEGKCLQICYCMEQSFTFNKNRSLLIQDTTGEAHRLNAVLCADQTGSKHFLWEAMWPGTWLYKQPISAKLAHHPRGNNSRGGAPNKDVTPEGREGKCQRKNWNCSSAQKPKTEEVHMLALLQGLEEDSHHVQCQISRVSGEKGE